MTFNHVWTDLPNAIKLQGSRPLLPIGEKRSYENREQAGESPLAQLLFDLGGITGMTFEGPYFTVLMAEDADWDTLLEAVQHSVSKFFNAGGSVAPGQAAEEKKAPHKFGFRQVSSRPLEEQRRIVQSLLETEVNPAVASHGGMFSLVDIKDDVVYLRLGGGCQGCSMVDVTLRQGVEQRLRQVLPEMVSLVDVTDHVSGTDPYYQQAKK